MTVLWWTYAKEEQKLSDKWEQSKVEQEKVGDREELSREVNESSVKWVLKLSQRMFIVKSQWEGRREANLLTMYSSLLTLPFIH